MYILTKKDRGIGEQLSLAHKLLSLSLSDFFGSPTPYLLLKDSGDEIFGDGDRNFVIRS